LCLLNRERLCEEEEEIISGTAQEGEEGGNFFVS